MSSFTEKIIEVQKVAKGRKIFHNSHSKFDYRNLDSILHEIKETLIRNKLLMTITDEAVLIGSNHYIKATVRIKGETAEDVLEACAVAREPEMQKGMMAGQLTGATSSYARKLALSGLLLLDGVGIDIDTIDNGRNGNEQNEISPFDGDTNNPDREALIAEAEAVALKGDSDLLRAHFKRIGKEQRNILGAEEMLRINDLAMQNAENTIDAEVVENGTAY